MPARTAKKTSYHHGNLRRALLDAALELVTASGEEGFTLREAARRAGVSAMAPYRHFEDKDALLAALAEEGFCALAAAMTRAAEAAGEDPAARLEALGLAYVRFAVYKPSHFRIMFGSLHVKEDATEALRRSAAETYALLVETVRQAQSEGLVAGSDAEEVALFAWSVVHGLASLVIDRRVRAPALAQADVDELARRMIGLSSTGIARRAPASGPAARALPRSSPRRR